MLIHGLLHSKVPPVDRNCPSSSVPGPSVTADEEPRHTHSLHALSESHGLGHWVEEPHVNTSTTCLGHQSPTNTCPVPNSSSQRHSLGAGKDARSVAQPRAFWWQRVTQQHSEWSVPQRSTWLCPWTCAEEEREDPPQQKTTRPVVGNGHGGTG